MFVCSLPERVRMKVELEGLQSEVGRYPGGSRVPRGSCPNLNQKTRGANNEQVNELKNCNLSENLSANERDSEEGL